MTLLYKTITLICLFPVVLHVVSRVSVLLHYDGSWSSTILNKKRPQPPAATLRSSVSHHESPQRNNSRKHIRQWTNHTAIPSNTSWSLASSNNTTNEDSDSPSPAITTEKIKNHTEVVKDDEGGDEDEPEIVWLMSFPNSGTSYTIVNTERLTNCTTATNYGDETTDYTQIPVLKSSQNTSATSAATAGPYWHRPHMPKPRTVLTKTHCRVGAFQLHPFERGCRATVWWRERNHNTTHMNHNQTASQDDDNDDNNNNNATTITMVSPIRPSRAVHLIRHPLDNLVARKHMAVRKWQRRYRQDQLQNVTLFNQHVFLNDTAESFQAWCAYSNYRHATILPTFVVEAWNDTIPCLLDLLRYIQWHNLALQVTTKQYDYIPVHVLYYEDYSLHYNQTLQKLYHFLQLPITQERFVPFQANKQYRSYYTDQQAKDIARVVQKLATWQAWELLERYFS